MEYELSYGSSNLASRGCFLGNGKLGIVNGFANDISVEKVVITKSIDFKNGMYQPNVVEVFRPFGVELFSTDDMCQTISTIVSQSLNMDTGVATNVYSLERASVSVDGTGASAAGAGGVSAATPGLEAQVASSIYCARHLPYTSVHTLEITANKDALRLVHDVWTADNLFDVRYESQVKYVGATPIHIMSGSGKTADGLSVAFCSCYLFDVAGAVDIRPMGIGANLMSSKKNFQFNCFDIVNLPTSTSFKVHIISTFTTSSDFDDPKEEAIRIGVALCSPNPIATTHSNIAAYIRGRHVDAWSKLWATKLQVLPKIDASQAQLAEIRQINVCLYSALYHIYSCVRENFMASANVNALPVLDMDGSLIYEFDMWLVPALMILKPELARSLVEFRFNSLEMARQLAASYGFEGAKVPYVDDIIGYKNNMYFNSAAFVHLFNTCMVAVNAWNYYRMSKDKDWLQNKGFAILKGVAAYLVDVVEVDEDTGDVVLRNTVGLNNRVSLTNSCFTNNLVKLALKYAIEAAFEMTYDVPEVWNLVYANLPLPTSEKGVFKTDEESVDADSFNVLEVLHMFIPGIWENLDRRNNLVFGSTVKNTLEFYKTRVSFGEEMRPVNLVLQGISAGIVMGQDASYLPVFMSFLQNFMESHVDPHWKQMHKDVKLLNRRPEGLPFDDGNSVTTNALFVTMIMQGLLQMRIVGGISNTRFYYEDMKVVGAAYATMPGYWNTVSVVNYGTGNNKGSLDVRQNAYDMQYDVPNVGGAFIMNGDFGKFTP